MIVAGHGECTYTITTHSKIKHYETTTNKDKIRMEDACVLLGCL